ncbi:interferon-stimulated 20 kDa exonuclease-like 2 [Betta splendens]|uniref:Interferon-stimulated 20 kDa exonuclease-like 2 n=1 Tax=Betta splendens TaxID=158456 RepID=A0A6P7KNV3_BETSP|nr:interferon-stimulated 20 kDa exonuclease-like 2 [Betta splendens]XP_028984239.1 interferon-stimulated 20 kDa exonuclease-like 2 [Betta splendens]
MSDININISFSNDTLHRRTVTQNRKRKNKKSRKKERFLQNQRNLERGPVHTNSGQTAAHNGADTSSFSLLHPDTTARTIYGPSRPSLPSRFLTVKSESKHEKPKEAVKTKSASTNLSPSAPDSHKPPHPSCSSAPGSHTPAPTKYLAIDCEMVGTGPKGSISQLARCSIVSYEGDIVYDKFINPPMPVTDYRTRWSGIRRCDLIKATPYNQARKEILKLLMGKVVVGHAIHNDFRVLGYTHPTVLTRDTSRIPLLNLKAGFVKKECASLKRLTKAIFNRDIQTGKKGHSSVEDARATMELYRVVEEEWERTLATKSQST